MTLTAIAQHRAWGSRLLLPGALLSGAALGLLIANVGNTFLLLIIIAGFAALAISFYRLEWGLLIFVFITYTRFSDVAIDYHGAPSIAKLFVLLLLFGVLARWAARGERPSGWEKPAVLLFGAGLVGLVSALYAADPGRVWQGTVDFTKDALIALTIIVLLQRGAALRGVLWSLLAAGAFLGTLSVTQYLSGAFGNDFWGFAQAPVQHIYEEVNSNRVAGPIGDANFYAQVMLVLVPLAVDRMVGERNWLLRLAACWVLGVSILTVIFTFSRGAFLALLFIGVAVAITRRIRLVAWLGAACLALALIPFLPDTYLARLSTLSDLMPGSQQSPLAEPSFRGRASELLVGWMMFRDHPIGGVGLENYPVYYLEYSRRLGLDPRLEQRDAHNLYLEVAAETGLAGLAFFGLVLWSAWRSLGRSGKKARAMGKNELAGMINAVGIGFGGYLAAGIFIHNAFPRFFWLLVGLALALPQVVEHESLERAFESPALEPDFSGAGVAQEPDETGEEPGGAGG
jgi:O-antigen ligase